MLAFRTYFNILLHIGFIFVLSAEIRADDSLNDFIMKTIKGVREMMPKGDKDLKIPVLDPLELKNIDINVNEPKADIKLKLNTLVVEGLSKFNVTNLNANMENFKIDLNLLLEGVKISGSYNLDGKVMKLIPLYGEGNLTIAVSNFKVNASIALKLDTASGKLTLDNLDIYVDFKEAMFLLENILGGGNLGDMVNLLLNSFARPLFEKKRDAIQKLIKDVATKALDKELKKLDIGKMMHSPQSMAIATLSVPNQNSVNQYVDMLLGNMKADPNLKIDPLVVENQSSKQHHIKVTISNGKVYGLKSVHRVGLMALKCTGAKCSFTGEIGVNGIRASFNTKMRYHFVKIHPSIEVKVSDLRVRFSVNLDLTPGAKVPASLATFGISHMSTPSFKVGHLGPFGKLLQWLSRLIVPLVKGKIVNAVEKPMKKALEDQLKKAKLPF